MTLSVIISTKNSKSPVKSRKVRSSLGVYLGVISVSPHVFSRNATYKKTKSEKTNKHTIQLIYQKKRYEHTLFWKVIIIAFTHKNNKKNKKTLKHTCIFFCFSNEFARNAKRGALKKQTGRPKNSEKALSKY